MKETSIKIPCQIERAGKGYRAMALRQEACAATEKDAKEALTTYLSAHANVDQTPKIHVSDIGDVWILQRTAPDNLSVSRVQRDPAMDLQAPRSGHFMEYSNARIAAVRQQIWESTAAYQVAMFLWCLATGRRYVTCPHCLCFNGAVQVTAIIRCTNPGCRGVITVTNGASDDYLHSMP